ncbi:alpha-amylase family glycosyl hydrolase [Agarivorans aestuarii]|uniref:Alpha-amylase family glycosyl hydrolase n=1 Tax=Agarivorans aestuarii TaxID=1563703 RepID=A0ABU7G744_9ALTE|nr:alpha-amylase family glycosyl hydrolase [Agarivorans aestuarii]MEE1675238.1 alpha-amylase family glycosyl hydrolase [Agarivorans aestuarii]
MNWSKSAISMAVVFGLSACAGGGGGDTSGGNGGTYPGHGETAPLIGVDRTSQIIEVTHSSSDVFESLDCNNTSTNSEVCGLRVYQVMVESFIDGDSNHDYNSAYGNSHHKGDLQGIIDALPYIASTGSNALWLTPIFQTNPEAGQDDWADKLDGTGYFTSDYFSIDKNFGTEAQFQELVDTAHQLGLYVLLDGVFGHHKGNVVASPNGLKPSGSANPVSYPGVDNDTLNFYKEVATYWVENFGIDGWRLDQAYQVPVQYWAEIREAVEASSQQHTGYTLGNETVKPLGYMVAEIWKGQGDIADEAYGSEGNAALNSAFDFPVRYSLVQTLAGEEWGQTNGKSNLDASNLHVGLQSHFSYPSHAQPNLMLTNHDLVRFGDLLQRSGLANPSDEDYWLRHQAAFAFMAATSGPITLYYGDEIGDQVADFYKQIDCSSDGGTGARAGYCDDHVSRNSGQIPGLASTQDGEVFSPTSEQSDLIDYVKELYKLRDENPALSKGSRTHIYSDRYVFIDRKDSTDNHLLFLLNTKATPLELTIKASAIGSDGSLIDLRNDSAIEISADSYLLSLNPFESKFLSIESPSAEGPQKGSDNDDIGTGDMADCTLGDVAGGSLTNDTFLRGSWSDSNWEAVSARKFNHKGNDLYQVVINEAPGPYLFQIAEAGESWANQRSVNGNLALGTETNLAAGGYELNTNVSLSSADQYVYSIRVSNGIADSIMVSRCQ